MKLKHFEYCDAYRFLLTFENVEVKEAESSSSLDVT